MCVRTPYAETGSDHLPYHAGLFDSLKLLLAQNEEQNVCLSL